MTRTPFIAGNWKMNLDRRSAVALARTLAQRSVEWSNRDVAIFPPFVYLDEIARAVAGSSVQVGGQNLCDEKSGAFTGEVSGAMLKDVGATLVLCGHSERRQLYGEDDRLINRKLHAALGAGLASTISCTRCSRSRCTSSPTKYVTMMIIDSPNEPCSASRIAPVCGYTGVPKNCEIVPTTPPVAFSTANNVSTRNSGDANT